MKKTMKNTVAFLMVALATFSMSSCQDFMKGVLNKVQQNMSELHNYQDSEKWGKVTEKTLDLAAFEEIEFMGAVEVVFVQDSTQSVTVKGCEKAIEAYTYEVEDNTLEVKTKDNDSSVNQNTPAITLYISAPAITKIEGNGASDLKFTTPLKQEKPLYIEANGAADINVIGMEVTKLQIKTSGAGQALLDGVKCAEDADLEFNGAGTLNGSLEAQTIKMEFSGVAEGGVKVNCDKLKTEINGGCSLNLSGTCNSWKHSGPDVAADSLIVK